jgi:hypothetical protein
VETAETAGWSYGLAIAGDYAYLADHDGGFAVFELKHRRFDLSDDYSVSLPVATPDVDIVSVRLTSVQTPFIAWNVSADGGEHWQFVPPDSSFHAFTHRGSELVWRTQHIYNNGQVNPTVTWMKLEYFLDETGVDEPVLPTRLALRQNTPNPFNAGTAIAYDIPTDGVVARIEIFDVSGRRVRTLVDGPQDAGHLYAVWDGRDQHGNAVASGTYYCRMAAEDFEESVKLLLLR